MCRSLLRHVRPSWRICVTEFLLSCLFFLFFLFFFTTSIITKSVFTVPEKLPKMLVWNFTHILQASVRRSDSTIWWPWPLTLTCICSSSLGTFWPLAHLLLGKSSPYFYQRSIKLEYTTYCNKIASDLYALRTRWRLCFPPLPANTFFNITFDLEHLGSWN